MIETLISLSGAQIADACGVARGRWVRAKTQYLPSNNAFCNHLCGALAEIAVEQWLKCNKKHKSSPFRSQDNDFSPDLVLVDGRGIDVKAITRVFDKVRYPVSQLNNLSKKGIDLIVWCLVFYNPQSWRPEAPDANPSVAEVRFERWASRDDLAKLSGVEYVELVGVKPTAGAFPPPASTDQA